MYIHVCVSISSSSVVMISSVMSPNSGYSAHINSIHDFKSEFKPGLSRTYNEIYIVYLLIMHEASGVICLSPVIDTYSQTITRHPPEDHKSPLFILIIFILPSGDRHCCLEEFGVRAEDRNLVAA